MLTSRLVAATIGAGEEIAAWRRYRQKKRPPGRLAIEFRLITGEADGDRDAKPLAEDEWHEVAKAFEELVPTSVLKDHALAIAIELRHPAYDCFYLALAERSTPLLVTADERLIRRCANTPFENLVQSL